MRIVNELVHYIRIIWDRLKPFYKEWELHLTIALPQGLAIKLLVRCRLWLQVVDSAF